MTDLFQVLKKTMTKDGRRIDGRIHDPSGLCILDLSYTETQPRPLLYLVRLLLHELAHYRNQSVDQEEAIDSLTRKLLVDFLRELRADIESGDKTE